MKLACMQPYFLPYIGYFQLIQAVDTFILYDRVKYQKNGWMHRNRLLGLNKEDFYMRVSIQNTDSNTLIKDVEIDNTSDWQGRICIMLQHNYKRSPYFSQLYPFFEALLCQPFKTLSTLNFETIKAIAGLLEIKTQIIQNSQPYLSIEEQLQTTSYPYTTKEQRLFLICQQERAHTYINAIGGQKLYKKELFRENKIELLFLQTEDIQYRQPSVTFYPNLSILDMLMNCGTEQTKEYLNLYKLI